MRGSVIENPQIMNMMLIISRIELVKRGESITVKNKSSNFNEIKRNCRLPCAHSDVLYTRPI